MKSLLNYLVLTFLASSIMAQTKQVDAYLELAHTQNVFNGNVLISKHGEIIYQNSFGNADPSGKVLLGPGMPIEIGSISKEFNAVGIMMLKEEGKLHPHDKVSKFFPELPKWAERVSIKNLMQYTSGFPDVTLKNPITDEKAWEFLKNLKQLEFEPGSDYKYTNYNVFLQRRIIEKVSGLPYGEFLQKRIFIPLGMKNALVDPQPNTPKIARAFDLKMKEDAPLQYMSGLMYLTPDDLHKWVQALHHDQVITRESLLYLAKGFENNQSSLGSVVFKEGKMEFHYHHGSSYNYESSIFYMPEMEVAILLMTNSKRMNTGDLTTGIFEILQGREAARPKKSIYLFLRTEIMYEGIEKGLNYFDRISRNDREHFNFAEEEDELLDVGNYLLAQDKIEEALAIFQLAAENFPNSSSVFLELGKAYEHNGNKILAVKNYKRSLLINSDNPIAKEKIELIEKVKK